MDLGFMTLSRLAFGSWEAQPLFALAEIGIPEMLASGAMTAAELSSTADVPRHAVERLLNASVALKLLERDGDRYRNSAFADRFLTTKTQESLLHWVRVMGRWATPWARLTDAVRRGIPVEAQGARLGSDPAYMRDFILGMHEFARRSSDTLVPLVKPDARHLIDVGGGAGTYSISLCRALPDLHAEVLDLAPVLAITREVADAEGVAERLTTRAIDYSKDPFGSNADIVLLSNILHQESTSVCQSILERAKSALRVGGSVLVQGYFLNDDKVSPSFVTLHNLSALALWDGGISRTVSEMIALMNTAGFVDVLSTPIGNSGLVAIAGLND